VKLFVCVVLCVFVSCMCVCVYYVCVFCTLSVCACFSFRWAVALARPSPAHRSSNAVHPLQSDFFQDLLFAHQLCLSYFLFLVSGLHSRVFVPPLCLISCPVCRQTWRNSNRPVVRPLTRSRRMTWCKRDCTSLMVKKEPRLARATFASSVSLWCVSRCIGDGGDMVVGVCVIVGS
jgi:hypothetical protein